jgi:hypothetical protein
MSAPTLHPEFKEFLSCLTSHGVKFLIVGAHALAVHGRPRATADIDVLVEPSKANAKKLGAALHAFGFEQYAAAAAEHFAAPERMATLGHEPVRIDILSSITGVSFRDAWKGRVSVRIDDMDLAVLGLDELKRAKRAAGRPKDLLDLALLEEATPKKPARNKTAGGASKRSPRRGK